MARKKISEFNRVVPNSEDRIIIEQNGMGRSAVLSSLPVSNPTMEALNDVRKDVTKVYKFKGTVANKADLPTTDIVVGDAYNVSSEGKTYVYNGSSWIAIGVDAVTEEVLQAREGYDGTIYSDLGTAIRTQVSNLKTSQDQVAEELNENLDRLLPIDFRVTDPNMVILDVNVTGTMGAFIGGMEQEPNDAIALTLEPVVPTAGSHNFGVRGQICIDGNYLYVCVADNEWKKIPLQEL